MTKTLLVHATAVVIEGDAILLRGPSGAGDQVELRRAGERVLVTAPAAIAGLIEVRGVGIIRLQPVTEATLALLVDLVPLPEVDRFPATRCEDVLGLAVPSIALSPFEASAAAKLRFALRAFSADSVPAIIRR